MANRLAGETSPYLLQHAENPVDWYPWGEEAFERARREDKPLLVSIGYSACHWCHVMAHESFEDPETAALMNRLFVNVKVDREEHPDVDGIYMQAVQALTGGGGWPLTVFLTPTGVPWWGGTYFPPEDREGHPSFRRVLETLADAWGKRKGQIEETALAMQALLDNTYALGRVSGMADRSVLERAGDKLIQQSDPVFGGFGSAPKFPSAMALRFLLRVWRRTGREDALEVVRKSFSAMSRGGIFDQVGGGFHRYSVDRAWQVPHFEKMLYDNALLSRLGIELYQATSDPEVKRVTGETLAWALREMQDERSGGFYSSLDADSEGREGLFYLWTGRELDEALGADAGVMRAWWGVDDRGNFEGRTILHVPAEPAVLCKELGLTQEEAEKIRTRSVKALLASRGKRVPPGRDEKILASWNGLMLQSLADASRVLQDRRWLDAAIAAGRFLERELLVDGHVARVFAGGEAKLDGRLEDHASVALGFLSLHEATLDPRWIDRAIQITRVMECRFRDAGGGWYDTPEDTPLLISRPRDQSDNATPSGVSLAMELLGRLSELTADRRWREESLRELSRLKEQAEEWPLGFGNALTVTDMMLYSRYTVVLMSNTFNEVQPFLAEASRRFLPGIIIAGSSGGASGGPIALFDGRSPEDGNATAYLCHDLVCELPAKTPQALRRQLDQTIT